MWYLHSQMVFEDLKAALQPEMEQDVQAVYEEFVEETDSHDLFAFLDHLLEYGLIEDEIFEVLRDELHGAAKQEAPAEPPAADDSEDTTLDTSADADPPTDPGEDDEDLDGSSTFALDGTDNDDAGETGSKRRRRRREDGEGTGQRRRRTGARTGARSGARTGARSGAGRRKPRERGGPTQGDDDAYKPPDIPIGAARYDFIDTIGAGAMGEIVLARDTVLQRKIAFKQMSMDIAKQKTMASKFNQEAQITAQLDHPNIVPIYNLEVSPQGMGAYTMKLIKGKTLEDFVDGAKEHYEKHGGWFGPPPPDEYSLDNFLDHFLKTCEAMYYAHCRGVVHRDLKPENIMVGEFGELYVMDWGIAKVFTQEVEDPVISDEIEDEGDLIIGTPQYMSPEQADGRNEDLSGKSDQYALGLILYELVSLKAAVTGKAPLKIVMRQQDAEKDPLQHIAGKRIAPELRAIIDKATQKDLAKRYPNVHELAEDVKRYLRGDAVKAKRDNPWQALMRWIGKHRELTMFAFASVVAVGVVALLTLILIAVYVQQQAEVREQQLTNVLTTVGRQASLIDGQFLKYEGLLSVVATHAVESLNRTSLDNSTAYRNVDFGVPEKQPKDTRKSKRYDTLVSLDHTAFVIPRDVKEDRVKWAMERLVPMRRQFRQVMLRSLKEEAAMFTPERQRRAVADKGVPLAWTYIGLENGVYQVYPGHNTAGYKAFDPRKAPWYELAKNSRGPQWGAPHPDNNGMDRLVLTCVTSLYDHDEKFMGAAGVDVTFDFIIEELLEIEGFPKSAESFLVDNEGKIVVSSTKKGQAVKAGRTTRALRMPTFPVDKVVKDIESLKSGHAVIREDGRNKLVIYNRMHSLGWYYVVKGEQWELLSTAE